MTETQFNVDWFSLNIPEWEKYLSHLKGKPYLEALEVGSWEGRSACWTLQNILTHEGSKLTCIDNFKGNPENYREGYEHEVRKNFENNIKAIGAESKVRLIEQRSQVALKFLHENNFDFIYIDGSHDTKDVLMDLCLAWPLLKHGGIMIMDDYDYREPTSGCIPKIAIDAFWLIFKNEIIKLHSGWQMIWRKI